ncbi:MAG: riboflavin synthase [Oscillospiraceae bacterium]|nr:riboflavin synthase [Oscillospiraceae bacterium]
MFTGIIEEIGHISQIRTGGSTCTVTVAASRVLTDVRIGDSIAVNGTCLTVCSFDAGHFSADVMPETMRRTNLGGLAPGAPVNLERAMAAGGRFGGHIVTGHIDGTGHIRSLRREGNAVWVTIMAEEHILRYIVEKGSIAIDGISLTVAAVTQQDFAVSVIPHTGSETTLLTKKPGDAVNLECDIVAKYVEKLCGGAQNRSGISQDFLAQHGFL